MKGRNNMGRKMDLLPKLFFLISVPIAAVLQSQAASEAGRYRVHNQQLTVGQDTGVRELVGAGRSPP